MLNLSHRSLFAGTLAVALSGIVVGVAQDADQGKVPHLQIIEDLEKDLDAALLDRNGLEAKVKNLSSANGVLAESMKDAKVELEELRETYKNALLRLELLSGVLEREDETLEGRLIKAAADLEIVQEEKEQVAQALVGLSSAAEALLIADEATRADAGAKVTAALKQGEVALGLILDEDHLAEKTLEEAQVITVNKEYNLILVDVGKRQGLRVGTPIGFHRKDRTVGSALVTHVRDDFAGAILLELSDPNDQIMVGDRMRIAPEGV